MRVQCARGAVAWALQVAGDKLGGLILHDGEGFGGQRGMEFVVGQQFHSAGEVVFQHLDGKFEARGLIGRDVVQRFLKGKTVERLGAVE